MVTKKTEKPPVKPGKKDNDQRASDLKKPSVVPSKSLAIQQGQMQSIPLAPGDERTWGMLSHLTVLLNLVTGLGGPIAALVIYLVYKDRSRFVAYHSLQALVFQLIWWVGGGALAGIAWAISGVLSAVFIGLLCMPLACLISFLPLGGIIYGIVGAVQTSQGQDFKYWLVGDWTRGTFTGK